MIHTSQGDINCPDSGGLKYVNHFFAQIKTVANPHVCKRGSDLAILHAMIRVIRGILVKVTQQVGISTQKQRNSRVLNLDGTSSGMCESMGSASHAVMYDKRREIEGAWNNEAPEEIRLTSCENVLPLSQTCRN